MTGQRLWAVVGAGLLAGVLATGCAQFAPPRPPGGAGPTEAPPPPAVTRIPVEGVGYPTTITMSPSGDRAYVLGTEGVAVVDTGSRAVVATIPMAGDTRFRSVAVAPDGSRAYVPGERAVAVVDTATDAVVSEIDLPIGAGGDLAVSPDGSRLYDASGLTGTVTVIDVASAAAVDAVEVDTYMSPMHIALTPDGRTARLLTSRGLTELDTATGQVTGSAPVGDGGVSSGMALSPDGARTYVSSAVDAVTVVEGGAAVGEVHIARHSPGGLAVSPDGGLLFVGGRAIGGGRASVVDTSTRTVLGDFDLGHQAPDIEFARDAPDTAYAIDYSGRSVSVVDLSTFR
jgi:DNA-binding beta-propeller fold protein YncE